MNVRRSRHDTNGSAEVRIRVTAKQRRNGETAKRQFSRDRAERKIDVSRCGGAESWSRGIADCGCGLGPGGQRQACCGH